MNTAARMQALTKEHAVSALVSAVTAEQAGADGLREIGEVSVRGRERAVGLYTFAES